MPEVGTEMNGGVLFLLAFAAVVGIGVYQESFAEKTVTGYDYFETTRADGTVEWKSHKPYVFDGEKYVPFIEIENETRTAAGNIALGTDGKFRWNGHLVDSIALITSTDGVTWTLQKSVNEKVPDITNNMGLFSSAKLVPAIGLLEYKYILQDGSWKTQLEFTKRGGNPNLMYGFQQTVIANTDVIAIGDVKIDVDQNDGAEYLKQFITDNGGVLDLGGGIIFDFDIGIDDLYSVNVYDNGIDSSRLVFEYRTSTVLANNETLIIDPTFTYTISTDAIAIGAEGQSGSACGDAYSLYDNGNLDASFTRDSSSAVDFSCERETWTWDISSIPNDATITDVTVRFDVGLAVNARTGDFVEVDGVDPRTLTIDNAVVDNTDADLLWDAYGTVYVSGSTDFQTVANDYVQSLGASAVADLQDDIADGYFVLGAKSNNETRDGSNRTTEITDMELQVTYTIPTPDAVDDLTFANLGTSSLDLVWTQPGLNGGNLTNYMVNSTTPWSSTTSFLANTTNTYYNVTGLTFGTPYSFSVSALTENGYNFTGNVLNITTDATIYTGVAPTSFTVNDCAHTCTTQLNLEWFATLMDNINGFRIFYETPIGNGFTILDSNTTTTTTYYNHTSLTAGQFYNYKVAAMNSSGLSENSTTYAYSPHRLPDAVDDLTATPNDLLQFELAWTAPELYGTLSGYNINYTTPAGDPLTVYTNDTGSASTAAVLGGLDPTTEHTFRVSAVTIHGKNITGANLPNATGTVEIEIGDLTFEVETNPDAQPIWFELINVDNVTDTVQVRFDSALTVDCTVSHRLAGTNSTYTGLSETAGSGYVYHNFTVTNAGNDILDWDCVDQTNANSNGQYSLTQTLAASGVGGAANVPLFSQINNFSDGLYGTDGDLAGIDLITLFIVIASMIGFNRTHPALGVGMMTTMLGAAWYFELIPWTSAVLGGIALVVVLSIGMGLKKRD